MLHYLTEIVDVLQGILTSPLREVFFCLYIFLFLVL
jgi:hypothetical protein